MQDDDGVGYFELLNSYAVNVRHGLNNVRDQVRLRRADLSRVKNRIEKMDIDPRVDRMRKLMHRKIQQLDVHVSKLAADSQTEKLWYTLSLLNIFWLGIIVAHLPQYLHVVYTVELSFLLPIRFWTYRQKHYQYFLADLCYFVNFLVVLYVWVWPGWTPLWVSCFSFSFGTLAISVALWRNSLVMQSVDKTTSAFIHLLPPLVCHTINFRLDPAYKRERFSGAERADTWQTLNSIVWTTVLFFVWQSSYHFFITVRKADKIKQGWVTSFEYMRRLYAKTRLGKFVNGLPGPLPELAFTMIQFAYHLVTMIPCPIWYKYETLSASFLMIIFSIAAYNGATYYIDVYGQRFHKEVKELQAKLDSLEAAADDDDDEDDENEGENEDDSHGSSGELVEPPSPSLSEHAGKKFQ